MSKCIKRYIQLYSDFQGPVKCPHKQQLCDSTVLGIISQKLGQYQVYNDQDAPASYSIEEIKATLEGIKPQFVFFDNNVSGCCDQPQSCKCSNSICIKCRNKLCTKCHHSYQKSSRVNHATCFPFKGLRNKLWRFIQGVEGLELAKFARKTSQDKPAVEWDSLNYV